MSPDQLPEDSRAILADEFDKPYFLKLEEFVNEERATPHGLSSRGGRLQRLQGDPL